jgi:hypothetical protein
VSSTLTEDIRSRCIFCFFLATFYRSFPVFRLPIINQYDIIRESDVIVRVDAKYQRFIYEDILFFLYIFPCWQSIDQSKPQKLTAFEMSKHPTIQYRQLEVSKQHPIFLYHACSTSFLVESSMCNFIANKFLPGSTRTRYNI